MKEENRTFTIYPEIEMKEVRFKNHYGIELAGHLYLPKHYDKQKNPIAICDALA